MQQKKTPKVYQYMPKTLDFIDREHHLLAQKNNNENIICRDHNVINN